MQHTHTQRHVLHFYNLASVMGEKGRVGEGKWGKREILGRTGSWLVDGSKMKMVDGEERRGERHEGEGME